MARPSARSTKDEDVRSVVIPAGLDISAEIKTPEDSSERVHRLK